MAGLNDLFGNPYSSFGNYGMNTGGLLDFSNPLGPIGLGDPGYTTQRLADITSTGPFNGSLGVGSGTGGGGIFGNFIGTRDSPGWGGMALGGISSVLNGIMGMRQLSLAKKSLAENRRQFDTNFAAQRGLVNSQLEDRQRARVASNPGAYESVGSYMDKYSIKGK